MMAHAIEKAVRLSADFPVTAIVLDVYKDNRFAQRLAFYKRLGFSSFSEEDPAKMYLSIADARKTMEAASVEAVPAK